MNRYKQYSLIEESLEDSGNEAQACAQMEYDQAPHPQAIAETPAARCPCAEELPF